MMPLALHLLLLLPCLAVVSSAFADVNCEDLPKDRCAFATSASSKRCVLESYRRDDGRTGYQCRTSEVVVVKQIANHVETDGCIKACGVNRGSVGISSDALLEPQFTDRLCSSECYQNCPNIVDLYYNLAAGEGVSLPDLCQARRSNPHRAAAELMNSGAAPGPVAVGVASMLDTAAPAPGPVAVGDASMLDAPAPKPFDTIFNSLCVGCL